VTQQLVLSLAAESIERVEADVAVVTLFRDDRPLRGSASRVDWRLCGRLSRLLRAERFAGDPGEAALFPTQGGLRAPMLIATGLGVRGAFDGARCRSAAREAVDRALKLRAGVLTLALLEAGADAMDLGARIRDVLRGALSAPGMGPSGPSGNLVLRLVAAPGERPGVLEWLRSSEQQGLPGGVEVELPSTPPPRRGMYPRGAERVSHPSRPLVK
jgi:hypothetical protein